MWKRWDREKENKPEMRGSIYVLSKKSGPDTT